MKKLSKIVALLLAGALTMLLFTACGGTGNDAATAKFEANVEQAYMAKLNEELNTKFKNYVAIKELKNDDAIKTSAVKHIEEVAKKETLDYNDLWVNGETTQDWVMICYDHTENGYVMSSYEAANAETITPNQKSIDAFLNLAQMKRGQVGNTAKFTALGVGAKTINGKTYVAIGFRVEG